jgi:hypothetical protein
MSQLRLFSLLFAGAYLAHGADPFSLVGTAINLGNPDKPAAAPMKMAIAEDGTCTLTISPPLFGSGSCAIKTFDKKSGHIEIVSTGVASIAWSGEVKGNFVSGTYQVGQESGKFYLAIVDDASTKSTQAAPPPTRPPARVYREPSGGCAPAIESSINGEFHGWDGETIFKLDNGQIWQQAEYDYTYSYSYHPDVTIYEVSAGCRLKVEGEEETILVKRLK